MPSAKGGSNFYVNGSNYGWAYRNPSNHYDTSTLYGQSIAKAQSVGGVELIIMHQGEADTNDHRTEAQYEADFATLIGNYRQDLHATIPIFTCQLGTITQATPRTDADVVSVRNAQHDLDNGTNTSWLPRPWTNRGLTLCTIPGRPDAIGERMAQAMNYSKGLATY